MDDAPASFVKARSFVGRRDGYVYKTGDEGLGYYLEDAKSAKRRHFDGAQIPNEPLPADLADHRSLATKPSEVAIDRKPAKGFNPYADLPPPKKQKKAVESQAKTEEEKKTVKVFAPGGLFQLEQVRCLHILRKHSESRNPRSWRNPSKPITRPKDDAMKDLEILRKKIVAAPFARAIFEEAAKQTSDCTSASKGGDLGWFKKGKMTPAFEQCAFHLDINELSSVVTTPSGAHLILRIA